MPSSPASPQRGRQTAGPGGAHRFCAPAHPLEGQSWPGMSLGVKQLTWANWDQPDPANAHFARLSPIVGRTNMSGAEWARAFLQEELKQHVPEELRELSETA